MTSSTTTTRTKTWSVAYVHHDNIDSVLVFTRSRSDLSTTIKEVSALGEMHGYDHIILVWCGNTFSCVGGGFFPLSRERKERSGHVRLT